MLLVFHVHRPLFTGHFVRVPCSQTLLYRSTKWVRKSVQLQCFYSFYSSPIAGTKSIDLPLQITPYKEDEKRKEKKICISTNNIFSQMLELYGFKSLLVFPRKVLLVLPFSLPPTLSREENKSGRSSTCQSVTRKRPFYH